MERLTEKHYLAEDHYMKCSGNCHVDIDCIDCPAFDRLVERLAAYEDTGFSPEAIKSAFTTDALIKLAAQALETTPERLRELAAADKDGRLVVLPCKVGKKLYYINGKYIIEVEVVYYKVDETGAWLFVGETYNPETSGTYHCDLKTERIGKTVFSTHEEAENALQEMEDKA